jgi:hypothetical protein
MSYPADANTAKHEPIQGSLGRSTQDYGGVAAPVRTTENRTTLRHGSWVPRPQLKQYWQQSRNPQTDPGRVFPEIAAIAARLCDGYNTGIFQLDGDHLRPVANHGPISAVGPVGQGTLPLTHELAKPA